MPTPNLPHTIEIALLEDDDAFSALVCAELENMEASNYNVTVFRTGSACFQALHQQTHFDVCLLDWYLPDMNGPDVMAALRRQGCLPPLIFLTSEDDPTHVAQVLLAGADDYVTKPPNFAVLHARIQALLRRHPDDRELIEKWGHLSIDYEKQQIKCCATLVALTHTEMALALFFFAPRGQLISRQRLNATIGVFGQAVETRRLDVHISHLRNKLGLTADQGWRLSAVPRQGYRLEFLN